MPRNQRVSIRGKGSDIFFEHLQPQSTEPEEKLDSIDASKHASNQASEHVSKQASEQAPSRASSQASSSADEETSPYMSADPSTDDSHPQEVLAQPTSKEIQGVSNSNEKLASKQASSHPNQLSDMQAGASASEQANSNASLLDSDRANLHVGKHASNHASNQGLEGAALGPENATRSIENPIGQASNATTGLESVTDRDQPVMPVSEQLSMQASLQASKPGTDHIDVLHSLWKDLSESATITNAFRFTEADMQLLTDATYSVSKVFGIKVSKQEVVRLALRALLLEYERERENSLLARYALRKQQLRRGDI